MPVWNESVTVFKLRVLRKSPQGRHTSTLFFFTIFSAAAQVLPELPLTTPARSIALAFSSKTRARPRSLLHAQLCAGAGACYSHCCLHGWCRETCGGESSSICSRPRGWHCWPAASWSRQQVWRSSTGLFFRSIILRKDTNHGIFQLSAQRSVLAFFR